jgi:hypothetical protein
MMRLLPGLALLVALAGVTPAQDNKAIDVVKKAVEAHGGEAALKKFPAGVSKFSGTILEPKIPYTGSTTFSVPGKVRVEMTFDLGEKKPTTVYIVNGKQATQREDGKTIKLGETAAAELLESAAIQEMSQLFPLLTDRYTLSAGADATYDTRECATVLVKGKGFKDTTLAFDKKTGYLTAMIRKGLNPSQQSVDEVTVFTEYKTIDGLVVPMKSRVSHDGRPFLEITVNEYKPLAKVDDAQFMVE